MVIVLDSLGQHLRDALITVDVAHVTPCTGNIDHEDITKNEQTMNIMLQAIMDHDKTTGTDMIILRKSELRLVLLAADTHFNYD